MIFAMSALIGSFSSLSAFSLLPFSLFRVDEVSLDDEELVSLSNLLVEIVSLCDMLRTVDLPIRSCFSGALVVVWRQRERAREREREREEKRNFSLVR